ncbi:hypothetical protein GCM10023258_36390 [Terrabacter aeriphilus]|uniref:Uncharacterized protein n=1 Tax=Terrabacter aeriphilus TaxID=515662 RepID=A0ABP9JKH5_9MICO
MRSAPLRRVGVPLAEVALVLDGPRRPLAVRGEGAGSSVLMPVGADDVRL